MVSGDELMVRDCERSETESALQAGNKAWPSGKESRFPVISSETRTSFAVILFGV